MAKIGTHKAERFAAILSLNSIHPLDRLRIEDAATDTIDFISRIDNDTSILEYFYSSSNEPPLRILRMNF